MVSEIVSTSSGLEVDVISPEAPESSGTMWATEQGGVGISPGGGHCCVCAEAESASANIKATPRASPFMVLMFLSLTGWVEFRFLGNGPRETAFR